MPTETTFLLTQKSEAHTLAEKTVEEPSSIWQSAYEHKTEIALGVGATAATAALFYAGRGVIGRSLGIGNKNVLLIEDTPYMAKAMSSMLKEQGQNVTWITGVRKLEPFTAIAQDGSDMALNVNRFRVAIVDGSLAGELKGGDIVAELSRRNVASIGMSTEAALNKTMLENGALIATNKPVFVTSLANNQLDLQAALKSSQRVQRQLDDMRDGFLTDRFKSMREKTDAVVKRFILEDL